MGKLTGIKVVDLTQFLPGPMLTVMMADHGAEVLKIEPPQGDPAREQAPFDRYGDREHSVWFANLNRGKKSIALNLKSLARGVNEVLFCLQATQESALQRVLFYWPHAIPFRYAIVWPIIIMFSVPCGHLGFH